MTGDDVRIGIVGLGNIGRHHAEQLQSLPDATLVGGVDVDPEARNRFGDRFGVSTYDDHTELFATVDALIVTTPNHVHEQYATAALEAGIPALLEKPLAHTIESAERIAAAATESDAFCMVGFHKRFAHPVEVLIDRRDAGALGEITHVEANFVRRRGIPRRGTWFTDRASAGGGALIDIGAHVIDLSLTLLEYPAITEVSGSVRREFGGKDDYTYLEMWGEEGGGAFDVEDGASGFLRCADGSTVSLEIAWASNRPVNNEVVVHGTERGARFDHKTGELTLYGAAEDGAPHFADTEIRTRDVHPHHEEQRYFVEAVREGRPPERNTVEQALVVQRVIDAIYRSERRGSAVALTEPIPEAD
jgi:predicted dehydrogenase